MEQHSFPKFFPPFYCFPQLRYQVCVVGVFYCGSLWVVVNQEKKTDAMILVDYRWTRLNLCGCGDLLCFHCILWTQGHSGGPKFCPWFQELIHCRNVSCPWFLWPVRWNMYLTSFIFVMVIIVLFLIDINLVYFWKVLKVAVVAEFIFTQGSAIFEFSTPSLHSWSLQSIHSLDLSLDITLATRCMARKHIRLNNVFKSSRLLNCNK